MQVSKYKQIKINLTPEHHQKLTDIAIEKNMTLAEYIRTELNIDLKVKPKVRKKRSDSVIFNKADPKLIYHLAKIGSNINQIARKLNTGTAFDRLGLATLIEMRDKLDDYKY